PGNPSVGCPHAVPSRVTIASATVCTLLFCDQSVSLRAQRISLENVGITPVVSRVDDDFEVVVQFLTDVPPQFSGDNPLGMGIEAGNAEIEFMLGVENADFGFVCGRLPLKRLSLPKCGDGGGLLLQEAVKFAVEMGCECGED